MRRIFIIIAIVSICDNNIKAQTTDSTLDILKAPSSPAANLLGISPSDVQRPTDPSGLMLSVQSATNNFSAVPSSYAVDIAPAWVFGGKNITFGDFVNSTNVLQNIWQSLVVSTAFTSRTDSINDANFGIGLKVSILRGSMDSLAISNQLSAIQKLNSLIAAGEAELLFKISNSVEYKRLDNAGKERMIKLADSAKKSPSFSVKLKAQSDSLKALVKSLDFTRHGWKLDLAGGVSFNFPDQKFNKGNVNKAGAWLTGGYECKGGFSILGLVRYLYNPDKIFADDDGILKQKNLSTLDMGLRILYDWKSKFDVSAEAIYRSALNQDSVRATYRFTINASYKLPDNKILTFVFGRDYDGTFNKDGNVLAALNLIIGLGNNRNLLR